MGRLFAAKHSIPPDRAFHVPGEDRGVTFLAPPAFFRREAPVGQIAGAALSAHGEINEKIRQNSARLLALGMARRAVVFNSVPVLLEDVEFAGSQARIDWKWLATGAAGRRVWNGYTQTHAAGRMEAARGLEAFFAERRAAGALPLRAPGAPALPRVAAITARNARNYYHFLTETLPHVHLLLTSGLEIDELNIHMSSATVGGFARRLIDDLFPEMAAKIRFRSGRESYPAVLSVYSFDLWYPAGEAGGDAEADADGVAHGPSETDRGEGNGAQGLPHWASPAGEPGHHGWGSYDEALVGFRQHALSLAAARGPGVALPERIFLRRRAGQSRQRETRGEDVLFGRLRDMGFREVYFEDHPPLTQVALMQNARFLVGSHGAGLANMMFAKDLISVIEIGTLQTCKARWSYFIPLAHLAGCRYSNMFVDFASDDPLTEPEFSVDSIVPAALSADTIDAVTDFIRFEEGGDPDRARESSLALRIGALANGGDAAGAASLAGTLDPGRITDPTLLRAMAGAADDAGDLRRVLACLERLNALHPPRRERFERLAWLTSRFGEEAKLRLYLAQYRSAFPEEFAAFVARTPRFRPRAAAGG